ncbi:cytochrome P450 [Nocardia ninae]|uniref:Cytochrome P450 n=1 Tax=Nocardia ninae NBRC 108245 TaxID=1210091 RepID=A0A511MHU5_9NOCA|nr:cytochrome P450 [Nocardia ninae]GEM40225.1 cytochrome P450 [Nocardia ninae NBRC 108245]
MELRDVPSAPGRLPVLGHGYQILRDPVQFMVDLVSVGKIVRVDIGSLVVYVITDFELLHRVLVENPDAYERGLLFERIRLIFGDSLIVADGQQHRDLRRLLQPAFHRTALETYAPSIKRNADALASSWQPGQIIEARSALLGLVIGTLLGSLFSREPDTEELQHISGLIADIGAGAIVGSVLPKKLASLPLPVNSKFLSAGTQLRDYCQQLLVTRRDSGERRNDLIDILLYSFGDEHRSDKFLAEQAVTILFGGIDATTATLTWAMYELAHRPEVASRLQQEISAAGDLSPHSLDQLDYLNRFLNEVTRTHSPLLQTRRSTSTVELDGFTFPAGTDIGYSIAAIHRNPNIFADPDTFDPDRWPTSGSGSKCKSFVPFSAGNQMCIGNNYAWIALQTILHSLLSKWEFQPVKTKKLPRALGPIPSMGRLPLEVRPVSVLSRDRKP